jgi:hypothetical protein
MLQQSQRKSSIDINGRSIKTIDLTTVTERKEIDISNAASGIYFYESNINRC